MATALELTPGQLKKYIRAAHRQHSQHLTKDELEERAAVLNRIREAAQILYTKYGATQVVLFGSLVHNAWFTLDSDIDIAVKGIGNNYWRAWETVETIIGDRSVDLVDWDMASESLRQTIDEEGLVL